MKKEITWGESLEKNLKKEQKNKDILKMQDKISKYLLSINFSKTHIPNDFMHVSGNTYYRIKNNKITKFKYHTGYRDFIDTAVWTLKEFIKYKKISDLK